MAYYLFPLVICLFSAAYYDFQQKKGHQGLVWSIIFMYLTILIGIRYEVGGDTYNYMTYYVDYPKLENLEISPTDLFQPFFAFLFSLARTISKEFYVFQLIHVFIFNTMLFLFIVKNTPYRFCALSFTFVLCYLYFTTEIMRESLAVMVFAFTYRYLLEKRWVRYYIGVFLACLFHISACVLLLLPLVSKVKMNGRFYLLLALVPVLMFFYQGVWGYLAQMSTLFAEKKAIYYEGGYGGHLYSLLNFLKYVFFPLFVLFLYKRSRKECIYENALCIIALLGLCAILHPVVFARFINYFLPFLIISFSNLVGDYIVSKRKVLVNNAYIVIMMSFFIYGSYYVHMKAYTLWCPYYSYLNPVSVQRYYFNLFD